MASSKHQIDGLIWSWLVFSIHDDYLQGRDADAGDQLSTLEGTPYQGYALSIRLGNLPPSYYETQRKIAASKQSLLGYDHERFAARDDSIEFIQHEIPMEPVPGKTWLTVELQESVQVTDRTGTRYLWNDMKECEALLEAFRTTKKSVFDAATAAIATVNSAWLDYPQVEADPIYIGAEGKEPTFVPQFQMGTPTLSSQRKWADLPETTSKDIGTATKALLGRRSLAITEPAGWLTASRREVSNPFLRFMLAYVGLEMLAARFEDTKRKRTIDRLEELVDVPLKDLIWPIASDKSKDPSRNAMFNFALMAVALSDDPRKDIDTFKPLKATRDRLFHGSSDVDRASLPAASIEQLLRRYLNLMAADEIQGQSGRQ